MLRLYGRAYCHLCEEMAQALRSRGVAFEEFDVDADPVLEARLGELVPVLALADGTEICHYRLDEAALSAALGVK
ncbi:MAG: glutaredoxin family protein [Burkholderiales bacterium]